MAEKKERKKERKGKNKGFKGLHSRSAPIKKLFEKNDNEGEERRDNSLNVEEMLSRLASLHVPTSRDRKELTKV